jgi:hypothetical protein
LATQENPPTRWIGKNIKYIFYLYTIYTFLLTQGHGGKVLLKKKETEKKKQK